MNIGTVDSSRENKRTSVPLKYEEAYEKYEKCKKDRSTLVPPCDSYFSRLNKQTEIRCRHNIEDKYYLNL